MITAKHCILFLMGGLLYEFIEIMWRGYTHPSMFLVGGVCFVLIGLINEVFPWDMPLLIQMAIAAMMVTGVEFMAGCILNLWLGLNVWDYSALPLNLLGQVSLPYMGLWFLLSAAAIWLDDWLRHWLFGEEKPRYKIFRNKKATKKSQTGKRCKTSPQV